MNQVFSECLEIIFELFEGFNVFRILPSTASSAFASSRRTGVRIMQIDIKAQGFSLSDALRAHAERRVRFALGASSGRVRKVVIRLGDENGPRGGIDKRCSIRAIVPGVPPVIVEQCEADLYVAIDRAAARVARTLVRRTEKLHSDRRDEPLVATFAADPARSAARRDSQS